MTDLAPIWPKIARLVPRLATEADGEVLATVRAIGRTLAAAGADWHDLAAALRPALPPPGPSGMAEPGPHELREAAEWLARRMDRLTPREADFVANAGALLRRGRGLSPRQAAWLWGLREQVARGAAR